MEPFSFSHNGGQGYPTERRESHWLPALRPDADTDLVREPSTTIQTDSSSPILQSSLEYENVTVHSIPESVRQTKDIGIGFMLEEEEDEVEEEEENEEAGVRLDPAWGFKRTDSAHLLDGARRTSSFPKASDLDGHTAPSEPPVNGISVHSEEEDFDALLNGANATTEDIPEAIDSGDDTLSGIAHDEQALESDRFLKQFPDNRFEEGIPLIPDSQAEPLEQYISTSDTLQMDAFDSAGDDVDTNFFSQIQQLDSHDSGRGSLERKSTKDVIDALHVEKRDKSQGTAGLFGHSLDLGSGDDDFQQLLNADTTAAADDQLGDTDSKWAAALDDDEFLVEDADDLLPDSDPGSPVSFMASLKEESTVSTANLNDQPGSYQQTSSVPQTPTNPYAPHQPSTSAMMQLSPKAHGNVGFTRPGLTPMGSFQDHLQQPTIVNRAESFADQAKGGYKSPYDLPMELAKPKKRPQTQRVASQPQHGLPPPPPRSSSMSSQKQLQSPFSAADATFGLSGTNVGAALPSGNNVASTAIAPPVVAGQTPSATSFFEELPVVSKPRPAGRYTPAQSTMIAPPQLPPASPPRQRQSSVPSVAPVQQTSDPYAQFQLRPPERIDPFANVAQQSSSMTVPTASANRYSPAPGTVPVAPRLAPSPRYSPAPSAQPPVGSGRYASQPIPTSSAQSSGHRYVSQPAQVPPSAPSALPFLPRTSSPLAYQGKPPTEQPGNMMPPPPVPRTTQISQPQPPPRQNTPPTAASVQVSSLPYSPQKLSNNAAQIGLTPPRRSQTQSPSRQTNRSALNVTMSNDNNRPASVVGQMTAVKEYALPDTSTINGSVVRHKSNVPELDFEQPQDETQYDPLQRWRGAPIFRFGFGGVIASSFPKHTPRYKAGQLKPQIKPNAGEVKTRPSKDLSLLPDHITTFPGPLKGKGKKKELLSWMSSRISGLESETPLLLGAAQTVPDPRKCHEELILLWKIVRIIVEHDGTVDNKPEALKALNIILAPEVHAIDESTASQYRGDTDLTGIYHPAGANARSESMDPLAVENLRKHLLKGEREQAVWKAADSRLWAHALLLASTVRDERKLWKQVVQEFVKQEVKPIGHNSESLSALYEIFGGNAEESIDQLVPPSARAGLQMINRVDAIGPTKNALDGLDKWKETLTLVLNNRTPDDQRALANLGALLGNYGRIQAAHICFLFARNPLSPNVFGGVDDPQASITLLGSDQRTKPFSFHQDQDALLLTEAYEFAISVLAPTSMSMSLPHLSAYKFQRAQDLADNGFKAEAQAYCDTIAASVTTKAKVSPYYHASLLIGVDDLAKRLKQVPVQSASWMAKPSVERATSSLLSKLSSFVAGDDSDAESKGSAAEIGPFAKTAGSPGLSRSGSQTDLYASYPSMAPAPPMTAASSRYAPGGITSARSSTELVRGRASLDSQRSPPSTSYGQESRQSVYAPSNTVNQFNRSPARGSQPFQQYGSSPSRSTYQPNRQQASYTPDSSLSQATPTGHTISSESYLPLAPVETSPSYLPTQPAEDISQEPQQPSFGGYDPPAQNSYGQPESQPQELTNSGDEQQQSYGYGYEPPADTGYVPYQPDPDSDDDASKKQKPKKKSLMEGDEDEYSNQKFSKPSQDDSAAARKKANDEAADAAFKAAAEADAQRAKDQKKAAAAGGGWLGGWFGGKKTESLDAPKSSSGAEPKVFKAKLGEDKMKLYYDKDLKKWVNPDDPDSMKTKSTPPPPPPGRSPAPPPSGGPPRAGGTPAPPMQNSRAGTPASTAGAGDEDHAAGIGFGATLPPSVNAGLGLPGSSTTAPPSGGLAPPSRPASNASSIDDLIGPAIGGRKGAKSGRAAKKGRYVDVMAQ